MKLPANNRSLSGRRFFGFSLLAGLALICLSLPSQVHAQAGVKGGEKSLNSATGVAGVTSSQGLGPFGRMLPVGQKNLDVKIPSFKNGLPSSLMRAGSMTRIDDDNMDIEKMDIRLFGPTKDRDVRVQLVSGTYHMPTQILSSEERSRISREDFQMEGDSMVFDTKTQQGKMTGNVRMVIYDTESFTNGDGLSGPSPASPGTATGPVEMLVDDEGANPEEGASDKPAAPAPLDINAPAKERPKADSAEGQPSAPAQSTSASAAPPVAKGADAKPPTKQP